jgi:hypothetical protein
MFFGNPRHFSRPPSPFPALPPSPSAYPRTHPPQSGEIGVPPTLRPIAWRTFDFQLRTGYPPRMARPVLAAKVSNRMSFRRVTKSNRSEGSLCCNRNLLCRRGSKPVYNDSRKQFVRSSHRMNTCELSVLSTFRMNTYEKYPGGPLGRARVLPSSAKRATNRMRFSRVTKSSFCAVTKAGAHCYVGISNCVPSRSI